MKIFFLTLFSLLFFVPMTAFAGKVPLADPFIMLYEGTYYAYGTHSEDGIEVYISDDLKTWRYQGLALNRKDSYGDSP